MLNSESLRHELKHKVDMSRIQYTKVHIKWL
jgi:hypothetical protein